MSKVSAHYYQARHTEDKTGIPQQQDSSQPDAVKTGSDDALLWKTLVATLAANSIPLSDLSTDLLAPIDQLHIGGRQATIKLLEDARIQPGSQGIEIGSGLGGTARLIRDRFHAQITAIDITPAFTYACDAINRALGYTEIVSVCGDACEQHTEAHSQDFVISQHTLMNIPDKAAVLATLANSLKPGGLLLLHEVVSGTNPSPLALPVPWASEPEHSHLPDQQALDVLLHAQGFRPLYLLDVTENALAWRKKHSQREAGDQARGKTQTASPLSPQLIFGERFIQMGKNLMANLAEEKVRVIEAIYEFKPG